MTSRRPAIIGVPVFNGATHLPEALESLVGQSFSDTAFVVVDDASTDGTAEIVRHYQRLDPRIVYERQDARVGMVRNWRAAFEHARSLFPQARYFAWGSDHDIWHPLWLEALVDELDRHDSAVAAYPRSLRIDESGSTIRGPWEFDTAGLTAPRDRFRATLRGAASGSMVYGLFRVDALERAGVFRPVIAPDRLLLVELSLYGEFRQVPRTLWYRRFAHEVSNERQRRAFYPERAPPTAFLPWWLTHPTVLAWQLGGRGVGRPIVSRTQGLGFARRYFTEAVRRTVTRRRARSAKRLSRIWRTTMRRTAGLRRLQRSRAARKADSL